MATSECPLSRKPMSRWLPRSEYAPHEDANTLFLERTFLAGDYITGVGYGVQLILYTISALYLWKTRNTRKQSFFLLIYITILLCIETLYQVVQARTVELMYITNRNYPGGPWAYFLATQNLAINVAFLASYFAVTFLSDLLVFWRCWVIWSASSRQAAMFAISFPTILLLASFVMGILWTLQSSQPGLSLYSALAMAYGTSYYALSLSTNIVLTLLIVARLLMYRRTIIKSLPKDHASDYTSLATIIVESASLYSTFAVLFLITYAVNNPMNQIFLTVASSAQQISNYLIIYRLAQGRAWYNDTTTKVTALDFGETHRSGTTMQEDSKDNIELALNQGKECLGDDHHNKPFGTAAVV